MVGTLYSKKMDGNGAIHSVTNSFFVVVDAIFFWFLYFFVFFYCNREIEMEGNTKLKPGWSTISPIEAVKKPYRAPGLSCDITNVHKQVKIKFLYVGTKRPSRGSCKMCSKHNLKQKKPSYICTSCGDFFCHDIEPVKGLHVFFSLLFLGTYVQ